MFQGFPDIQVGWTTQLTHRHTIFLTLLHTSCPPTHKERVTSGPGGSHGEPSIFPSWGVWCLLSDRQAQCFHQPLGATLKEHPFTKFLNCIKHIIRWVTCSTLLSHVISMATLWHTECSPHFAGGQIKGHRGWEICSRSLSVDGEGGVLILPHHFSSSVIMPGTWLVLGKYLLMNEGRKMTQNSWLCLKTEQNKTQTLIGSRI